MKNLSYLFLCFFVANLLFGCDEKPVDPDLEDTSLPEVFDLSRSPESPQSGENVVVSATVTASEESPLISVELTWTLNGANPSTVAMSNGGSGNVYSGTISNQTDDEVVVVYTVSAANKNGVTQESGTYSIAAVPVDYSALVLNEINGNGIDYEKYIELYNNSSRPIPLVGVTIYYHVFGSEPEVTWTGANQVIQPQSFYLLKGATETGDLTKGLSPTLGIIVEMFDPDENSIDLFIIEPDEYRENSYSRLPDGTGKWFLTLSDGTPGTTNGTDFDSDPIPAVFITDFIRDIQIPTTVNAVTVSATVKALYGTALSSVVLKWSHGSDITMTSEGDVYSATIPAQAAGSLVEYSVSATNDDGETVEVSSNYIVWPDGVIDYTKLRLNEVSGAGDDPEKFYELMNIGTEPIPLAGCNIYYNANGQVNQSFPPTDNRLTWTGNERQFIMAEELYTLMGRDTPGSFTTGLTPERILIITLTDPDGNIIDRCVRAHDTGEYAVGRDKSFSRIPDGTGPFYFTTPTPKVLNGTSSVGLLLVPQFDYSKLKLNEVSGVGDDSEKFYELINIGTENINLLGCKLFYNANGSSGQPLPTGKGNLTWTGLSNQTVEAGKLFSLIGRNTPGSFTTGLTAARNLIITFEDPAGIVIDQCIRAEDTGDYAFTDKSFSRIPDGTGAFYFTTPTPNVTNGTSTAGLILVPETQGGPPDDADYTNLILNEVSGEHKYVEIYNSGDKEIPLMGVKLQRNNGPSSGGSEWTGGTSDVIPAGEYRIFLFNSFTAGLDNNPAFVGWSVSSGISDQQILKVALVAPSGNPIDVFIRGDVPLPAWQSTENVTRNRIHSYSRMPDNSWAYAEPTPGAENGEKQGDIVNPGYLTAQP